VKPLRTTVTCLAGCGQLGTGVTGDPPVRRLRADWTRWAELDSLADRHAKTGHPTHTTTAPALSATEADQSTAAGVPGALEPAQAVSGPRTATAGGAR
jgi:hypothetical protein